MDRDALIRPSDLERLTGSEQFETNTEALRAPKADKG